MTDSSIRSIFKNDSLMGRYLDGDDDTFDESPRSSVFSTTDSGETLVNNPSPGRAGEYNTGPKGVRSDAMAFNASQTQLRRDKARLQAQSERAVGAAAPWSQDRADDDARDRWVEKRLKELSKAQTKGSLFEEVDAAGYLHIIESNRFVCVLIHHHEDDDDYEGGESGEVKEAMYGVAGKYQGIKMIRLSHHEAEIDEVACPAILAYEDGNLTVNAMRVVDELQSGEEISTRSVEALLLRLGVLKEQYKLDRE